VTRLVRGNSVQVRVHCLPLRGCRTAHGEFHGQCIDGSDEIWFLEFAPKFDADKGELHILQKVLVGSIVNATFYALHEAGQEAFTITVYYRV
jgi:hypothetical protein